MLKYMSLIIGLDSVLNFEKQTHSRTFIRSIDLTILKTFFLSFLLLVSSMVAAQGFESLYEEMTGYYQNKEYAKGIGQRDRFLSLAEEAYGKADTNYASCLNFIGFFYHQSYRYKEAGELYGGALKIYEQYFGQKHIYYANVAINLADVKTALKEYNDAEDLYKSALDYFKSTYGESSYYLSYLPKFAQLYEVMFKNKEAGVLYKKITAIYKDQYGRQSEYYAYGLFLQAQFCEKVASYSEAKVYYEDALEIYKNKLGEEHTSYAYTLNYLAHINDLMGNLATAEQQYKRALDIYKTIESDSSEYYASILNNLANLCKNTGRWADALNYYVKVENIYQKRLGEEHEYYATVLNNIAIICTEQRQFKKAEELYIKVYKIYLKVYGESHLFYAVAMVNLGDFYRTRRDYNMASDFYGQAIELHLKSGRENHPDYAITLYKLGTVLRTLQQYDRALYVCQKALDIQVKQLGKRHLSVSRTLCALGSLYQKVGQSQKAEASFDKMYGNLIYLIDNYFPSLSEDEKSKFYNEIKPMFEDFFEFGIMVYASNPDIGEKLYDMRLNTKAILLNTSNRIRNAIMDSKDSSLIQLYRDWNAKKEFFGKTFVMTSAELQERGINAEQLEMELGDLERRISVKSSDFANLYTKKPTSKAVQAKLKDKEAAIEIIRYNSSDDNLSHYVALVLTSRQMPKLVSFQDDKDLDQKYYAYYSNHIQNKIEDKYSYKYYWQPLEAQLKNIKTIYFSTDGVYNKISMGALQNSENKKYLNTTYDIRIVSNTRELIDKNAELTLKDIYKSRAYFFGFPDYKATGMPSSASDFSVMNMSRGMTDSLSRVFESGEIPELEGTKVEIQGIVPVMESLKIPTFVYTRGEATEERVKSSRNIGILHIATHGFFIKKSNSEEPGTRDFAGMSGQYLEGNPLLRSGLLLAGAEKTIKLQDDRKGEDGILTAYEAMNLDLNHTALVVLSACETGLGDIENGEGVYGLQRAFSVAGARYVLMSLWKVNDAATQELMVAFYKNWLATGDIHEAFRQAQQELQLKYKEPHYWAAFVLSGL